VLLIKSHTFATPTTNKGSLAQLVQSIPIYNRESRRERAKSCFKILGV